MRGRPHPPVAPALVLLYILYKDPSDFCYLIWATVKFSFSKSAWVSVNLISDCAFKFKVALHPLSLFLTATTAIRGASGRQYFPSAQQLMNYSTSYSHTLSHQTVGTGNGFSMHTHGHGIFCECASQRNQGVYCSSCYPMQCWVTILFNVEFLMFYNWSIHWPENEQWNL